MIRAFCNIPAYDAARFDASPWFEQAELRSVMALVREEWSGRPARDAAESLATIAGYSRLKDLLAYKRSHRIDPVDGKRLDIEIHIDPADALAWLARHRPHFRATIEAEYGDDAAVCDCTKEAWADMGPSDESDYLRPAGSPPHAADPDPASDAPPGFSR